jgi:thiamine biosynthesis protein ThiI
MTVILVRYNELGLKSPKVRRRFQNKLVANIKKMFLMNQLECIIDSLWGRIIIHTNDYDSAVKILQRIFGISSMSIAEKGTGGMEEITSAVLNYAEPLLEKDQSFAIRSRRTGKHDFTSIDLAKVLGTAVLDHFKDLNLSVNLKKPDRNIYVEVRHGDYYLFSEKIQAVGGLPLGTQGKVLGVYENKNSLIAWWMMMKRGASVIPFYLTEELIKDEEFNKQIDLLKNWNPGLNLKYYNSDDTVSSNEDDKDESKLELYLRILKERSKNIETDGIVSGMRIEDFQSQLELSDIKNDSLYDYPIFFPLIGLTQVDITELEELIFN